MIGKSFNILIPNNILNNRITTLIQLEYINIMIITYTSNIKRLLYIVRVIV